MAYLPRTVRQHAVGLAALAFLLAVSPVANAQPVADFTPVTDAMLEEPAPGDWLSWRRTPDGWGFRC